MYNVPGSSSSYGNYPLRSVELGATWGNIYVPNNPGCADAEQVVSSLFNGGCNVGKCYADGSCGNINTNCEVPLVQWAVACYPANYQGTTVNAVYTGSKPTDTASTVALLNWLKLSTTPPKGYQTVYNSSACQNDLDALYNDALADGSATQADAQNYNADCFAKMSWYQTTEGKAAIYIGGAALAAALIYVAILRAK